MMDTDTIPREHVISRARRQELQRLFELGQRIAATEPEQAHEALRRFQYCVEHDPRNRIYIEAFLQTAEMLHPRTGQRDARPSAGGWWSRWFDRSVTGWRSGVDDGDWQAVLRTAPVLLARNPWQVDVLVSIGRACQHFGYLDAALRYLQNGLPASWFRDEGVLAGAQSTTSTAAGSDGKGELWREEAIREYARTLAWTGRFATARRAWQQLLVLMPRDDEAEAMLVILQTCHSTEGSPTSHADAALSDDVDACLATARAAADLGDYETAHHQLAHANTLAAGHLPTQDLAEDVQLEQARSRIEIATRLHETHPTTATATLLADYAANFQRVALEVYHARMMRYPTQWCWRMELAECLSQTGNTAAAIDTLAAVPTESAEGPLARLREGECRQQSHDFEGALRCYREAVARWQQAPESDEQAPDEVGGVRQRLSRRLETLESAMAGPSGLDKPD